MDKRLRDLTQRNKVLIRRYFATYDRGDPNAVLEFVGANHVYHPPGGEESLDLAARKRDEAFFFNAFSGIQTTVEDQVAEGDKVVSRVTMLADHTGEYQKIRATGTRTRFAFIDIARIESGKIVEEWAELDMMSIVKQLEPNKSQS